MFIVIIFSFMHFFIVFFIFFLDTDHAKSQAVEPHVSDHRKKIMLKQIAFTMTAVMGDI